MHHFECRYGCVRREVEMQHPHREIKFSDFPVMGRKFSIFDENAFCTFPWVNLNIRIVRTTKAAQSEVAAFHLAYRERWEKSISWKTAFSSPSGSPHFCDPEHQKLSKLRIFHINGQLFARRSGFYQRGVPIQHLHREK